jgi:hypothetical protein
MHDGADEGVLRQAYSHWQQKHFKLDLDMTAAINQYAGKSWLTTRWTLAELASLAQRQRVPPSPAPLLEHANNHTYSIAVREPIVLGMSVRHWQLRPIPRYLHTVTRPTTT